MQYEDDTIAAIATPIGEGGLSIIRISGKAAFDVADRVFRGKVSLKTAQTHTAHFGNLVDRNGERIDEVVAIVYRSPHSYTAEDCVEISCHGGILVTRKSLEAILESGARLAQPGEFTKRAFLNGRIDLSQAEAVADLICSKTELSHRNSLQQLEGSLSKKINELRDELVQLSSLLELELDFAEEGIELTSKPDVLGRIANILGDLRTLIDSFSLGKVYRDGIKVVISGKPNVGKSSLLNALLNENRAIVTDIPGTTRDTIEESLNIAGILFRVVDTAGLRPPVDIVEKEGVRRTEGQIASSDIILLVVDLSQPVDSGDEEVVQLLRSQLTRFEDRCVVALNKVDIARNGHDDLLKTLGLRLNQSSVRVSAITGEGLNLLKQVLVGCVVSNKPSANDSGFTVTNIRHKEALIKAENYLKLALESIKNGKSGEFISLDVRAALDYLGEIVGAVTTDEILNNIFSKFCIGK